MSTFSVDPSKLEELLNCCLGFAKHLVESHGAFHPFGAMLLSSGTVTAVGASIGEEHPHGAAVFQFLQNTMRAKFQKREIVAASIATDVNIPPEYEPYFPDGIRVLLECPGYSRFIYLPYLVTDGRAEYGEFIPIDAPASICL